MLIERLLAPILQQRAQQYPLVGVIGPRQSGKTTLVRQVFADKPYVSLEDLDVNAYARDDPRGFLANYPQGAILDEVQKAPDLFSYLQTRVDNHNVSGEFILTGSQHFLLLEKISQSLAGRISLLTLLPFGMQELRKFHSVTGYQSLLFNGAYPRIYDKNIEPSVWYADYIRTYIERDIRQLKNVQDLAAFHRFIKLCAGRVGQILNLSALANDCGITHNTAKSWISLLETSFIIFLLKPYHNNFGKQLIKSPKLYFYDTGLACNLLDIETPQQLDSHYLRGSLFENLIIAELIKDKFNQGKQAHLFYWRDKQGHEIDCLIKQADQLYALEIKSGKTIAEDFFAGLYYWHELTNIPLIQSYLVYGGDQSQMRKGIRVLPWYDCTHVPEVKG
jgi:uncharacterized protein